MADTNSEYVLDALVDRVEDYGIARETVEEWDDEELISLVYSLHEDFLDLEHDEFIVYTEARSVLFDRGYTFGGDATLAIIDEETGEIVG